MEFPQRFGKYTLLKRIATGGMADIFLAHMRSLQGFEKEVVVKRLRPEHAANPDLVGMFLDEARTAANLTHANVAQIFDLGGDAEAGHFIAMEFVRGVDLRRVCEQGIAENNYLPLHHAVRIMADVCDALAYAHGEVSAGGTPLKVVHRDVSPTNILVSYDGAVK
ncbi:MAG: serine/threonine-protein kinase, partial [bacterium]